MKRSNVVWILGVGVAVLLAATGVFMTTKSNKSAAVAQEPAVQETTVAATDSGVAAVESPQVAVAPSRVPLRAIGSSDAPVKIEEFASLTCGHCADFSKRTFDKVKEAYIDTGKVYFVYHDFPLNAQALDAALIARCMPEERFFPFIKFLFETQEKWAFAGDYKEALRQNAKLVGMSDDSFDSCLANMDLKNAIAENMQNRGRQHKIDSTPSFVINGQAVIKGDHSFPAFERALTPFLGAAAAPAAGEGTQAP